MARATSSDSVMHCLHLVVGIALCLSWFTAPVVQSSVYLTPQEEQEIVDAHNSHRRAVYPPASNMQRVYWSAELAREAQEFADQCSFEHNINRHHLHKKYTFVGENLGIGFSRNISQLVWYWSSEGDNYHYYKKLCLPKNSYTYTCEHYLQLVRASTCEVGCAISECSGLSMESSYYYYHHYHTANYGSPAVYGPTYLVVCNYGPGYPVEDLSHTSLLYNLRPYKAGTPCSYCPEDYPLCDTPMSSQATGEQEGSTAGLCYNQAEVCLGSDPHFAIRMPAGDLLCYTFQGLHNTTFNLVSNEHLQMNALFVPDDTNWDNTWLGSIGITVFHDGMETTTLQFTAADQLIMIGEKIQMDAKAVKKLTFHNGKLTMLEVPSNHTPKYPRVQVQFVDSNLNFTIGFAKNGHLDLYWHSTGVPYKDSNGVVGQFFRNGVNIDVEAQVLHVPGRPPVPVEKKDLLKFMEQSFHSDSQCWTSAYRSSQGAGIVAGSYEDYIVDGLL